MIKPLLRFTVLQLLLVMLGFAISAAIIRELIRQQSEGGLRTIHRFEGFVPERIVEEPER